MKVIWTPASRFGRYAVWCAGAFFLFIVLNVIVQTVTEPRGDSRAWYEITLIGLMVIAAAAGAVLALAAIIRKKDYGILTFMAAVPALFVLLFELVFE